MKRKAELRAFYKQKREQLSDKEWARINRSVLQLVRGLKILQNKQVFHCFLSIEKSKEVDTRPIIEWLWGDKRRVICSITNTVENSLRHVEIYPDTRLEVSSWGIPEPVNGIPVEIDQIEVVFVPLLVADKFGHRIGYGKGFYDRFLAGLGSNAIKIGLSSFAPISKIEDIESYDIPLDYLIYPNGIMKF